MAFQCRGRPSRRALAVAAAVVAANLVLFVLIAEDLLQGGGLISHDDAVLAWSWVTARTASIRVAKLVGHDRIIRVVGDHQRADRDLVVAAGSQALLAAAPLASLVARKPFIDGGEVDL